MKLSIKQKIDKKIADHFLNENDQLRFSTDYTDLSIDDLKNYVDKKTGKSEFSINRPDLWDVNTEIDFGNNLYGYREKDGKVDLYSSTLNTFDISTEITGAEISIINGGGNVYYESFQDSINGIYCNYSIIGCDLTNPTSLKIYWVNQSLSVQKLIYKNQWVLYLKKTS
jgi:hypothetical protein